MKNKLGYKDEYMVRRTARKMFEDSFYDEEEVRAVDDLTDRWEREL